MITPDALHQLLKEDREWLLKQPRTLERDHIDLLLTWCMLNIVEFSDLCRQLSKEESK